jgi:glutathione S-transferase
MSTILYFSPGSSSLAVHILLEEVGLPYRLELVSAQERKPTEPAFLKINPKGRVPVLELDGVLLTEAPAILFYLANTHPKARLLPADPMGQFRCLEWFNWVSTTLHAIGYTQLWRPERFIHDSAHFNAISSKGRENIADAYRHIEILLSGRSWAVGDAYSCVDPYLLVFFLWGMTSGFAMQADYPAWSDVMVRVLSREAVQRVLQQEDIRLPD